MWKKAAIFVFYLLFSFVAFAGNEEMQILQANTDTIKIEPGSTSNIVVKLVNNTETDKNFQLKIHSPQGWKCLTNFGAVTVEKTNSRIKILSIYIPEFTKAGYYEINIDAYNELDNAKIGAVTIPVYVLPKYEILINEFPAPVYVVSGDSLSVKFMVKNLSNVEVGIKTNLKSEKISERQTFTLAPDSFIIVNRTIATTKNLLQNQKQNISFEASIDNKPETQKNQYHYFDVISSNKIKFDAYNRFPVKISPLFITNNRNGNREYAFMFDASGMGVLNEEKGTSLEFHFRGPDRKGESLLGIYDEYYAKYKSPHSNVTIGDNNYGLSYLTEFSRYGRGAGYKHTFKKLQIEGFINYPRFYPKTKRVILFNTNYTTEKKYEFNAGYLNKQFATDATAHLLTLSGKASPYKWIDLELEYAMGLLNSDFSQAYKTVVKTRYKFFSVFFNYTMAEQDFPGYFSNSEYLGTGASAQISKKINVNFNYNFNHNNIALDTLFNNAPFSENLSFSTNYSINSTTGASVTLQQREREDRMEPKKFHYNEKTIRFSLSKKINQLGINIQGETGKTTNYLEIKQGEITAMDRANLTLNYKVNNRIFLNGFVTYNNRKLYSANDNMNWYYGCSANASFGEKVLVTFDYQNNYEIEEYYRDRSIFSLNTNYKINRNNEISISGRYNLARNTLDKRELEVMVKYAYTINVRVSKKKDLGTLKGKVINNGVDNIEGIRFTMGGNIAISDKNGLFSFPVVKKGIQYLMANYSSAGLHVIAEIPGPYKLDIIPGADNYFEITLTKSAKISGNIVVKDDENKGEKGFVAVKVKLNKLIIEAKKGDEVYRVLTDNNGNFSFEGLRPGIWSVQVYKNGIPKEYELLTEFFNVNLVPGQNATIEVNIQEKQRRIKFQEKF